MREVVHRYNPTGESWSVLTTRPPRHWYNYLWSEKGYCAQVSQAGHGSSYLLTPEGDMCKLNSDSARYFYLRDEQTGDVWSPTGMPFNRQVGEFECEHGLGFTRISSQVDGIVSSFTVFVPTEGFHEIWDISLRNSGDSERTVSFFSLVSFELEGFDYPRYYEVYRSAETIFDPSLNGVYCGTAHPFAPHGRYNGYIASTERVTSYDGDLHAFLGTGGVVTRPDGSIAGLYQQPETVVRGGVCTNSETTLFMLGGVLHHTVSLSAGETKRIRTVIGLAESLGEATRTVEALRNSSDRGKEAEQVHDFCVSRYESLTARLPNQRLQDLMNRWVQKQVEFCRVSKKGVRDNLQIAVGLLSYMPELGAAEIEACLAHQFRDGSALLTWYPYDNGGYSDQPFWIVWSIVEAIKEIGDFTLLDRQVPFEDGGTGTVREHLRAATNRLIEDRGSNGLVKLKFADWNDALNVTTDPEAESVMLSAQACLGFAELARLYDWVGEASRARELREEYQKLKAAINEKAWDGSWYVRALSRDGAIGSASEGRIYLNAQVWPLLAGVAEGERVGAVLKALDGMEHEFGFPICTPPNSEYSPASGRMSGMFPGLFENGGVYCHATGFKALMDCYYGRGEEALRALSKIAPDSPENPSARSGAEPYAFTNCYATHPKFYGKSYQSWTTGTSAWALITLYEGILGMRRDFGGLRLAPCLPGSWDGAEATRVFRGTRYRIVYRNSKAMSREKPLILVDGTRLDGNMLPRFDDDVEHHVEVEYASAPVPGAASTRKE